jgi:hypothetical protein
MLSVGDFDGDGHADILNQEIDYTTSAEVLYGDGVGHFTASPTLNEESGFAAMM